MRWNELGCFHFDHFLETWNRWKAVVAGDLPKAMVILPASIKCVLSDPRQIDAWKGFVADDTVSCWDCGNICVISCVICRSKNQMS